MFGDGAYLSFFSLVDLSVRPLERRICKTFMQGICKNFCLNSVQTIMYRKGLQALFMIRSTSIMCRKYREILTPVIQNHVRPIARGSMQINNRITTGHNILRAFMFFINLKIIKVSTCNRQFALQSLNFD